MGADCATSNLHDLMWESMRLIGFLVFYSPHHLKDKTKGTNKKKEKKKQPKNPQTNQNTQNAFKLHEDKDVHRMSKQTSFANPLGFHLLKFFWILSQ